MILLKQIWRYTLIPRFMICLPTLTLLWRPSLTSFCGPSTQSEPFRVLYHHVIDILTGRDATQCFLSCHGNPACFSFNIYERESRCVLNNGSHLSYPEDMGHHFEGYYVFFSERSSGCSNKLCCGIDAKVCDSKCILKENKIDYWCDGCRRIVALGMESGDILNSQINSSSSYNTKIGLPWNGRLHSAVAWAAATTSKGEYLQVDLRTVMRIEKIATQGHPQWNLYQWVTAYTLLYANVTTAFAAYQHNGTQVIFTGNSNHNQVHTNTLDPGILARYVRVVIETWNIWIAMRLELYGCGLE